MRHPFLRRGGCFTSRPNPMSTSATVAQLFNAAIDLHLPTMEELAGSLPTEQLRQTVQGGVSVSHAISTPLFFFKAGELSRLVPWPNASKTIYSHDARTALAGRISVRATALRPSCAAANAMVL